MGVLSRMRRAELGRLSSAAVLWCVAMAAAAAEPGIEWRGVALLPGRSDAGDGSHRIAETSGIAWLGDDRYLAVMDGSDRAVVLRVALGAEGEPDGARVERTIALDGVRDWEDLAVIGPPGARRLLAVEEDTPALRAFALDPDAAVPRAEALGAWPLGEIFPDMRPNRGPESLAVEPEGRAVWTANEEALAGDGPVVADGRTGRIRLVRIASVDAAGRLPEERREWIYEVDAPHERLGAALTAALPPGSARPFSGVTALVALGAGRLLVLERSAAAGVPPLEARIYLVDTAMQEGAAGRADVATADPLPKRLLWRGQPGVNLEGLCAGPTLPDGRRALVGIADNAGRAGAAGREAANPVVVFALTTP
jgi:hypothetical protein